MVLANLHDQHPDPKYLVPRVAEPVGKNVSLSLRFACDSAKILTSESAVRTSSGTRQERTRLRRHEHMTHVWVGPALNCFREATAPPPIVVPRWTWIRLLW